MQSPPMTKKIKLRYKDAPQKVSFAASGVWGGNNFQGQLVVNFFVESRPYPESTEVTLEVGKKPITHPVLPSPEGELVMTREIQASVVLDPNLALVIGEWLVRHGRRLRDQLKRGQMPVMTPGSEELEDVTRTSDGDAEAKA